MCRMPHRQRRSNRLDVGAVLSIASRQRSKMIEWSLPRLLSLWAKIRKRSKLISTEQKGEMQMPKEMSMKEMGMSKEMSMNGRGGHLYMQTNEVKNTIIHYHRSANGTLTEVERVATGATSFRAFKRDRRQENGPNTFYEGGEGVLIPNSSVLLCLEHAGPHLY